MGFALLTTIFLLHKIQIFATGQSGFYQNRGSDISVGDFRRESFHHLEVNSSRVASVSDSFNCIFLCLAEPNCSSFNMAATPERKAVYLCELLSTDKYRASDKLRANASFHHYSPRSPCESSPCKNGAVCVPEYECNSYHCDCKTGFTGIHCAQECLGNKMCSQIKICHPNATNGSYLIDPDGIGGVTPFQVECDMTSMSEVGVTVISHDSEDKTLVDGYSAPGSYSRDIRYIGASLSQLASLIEQSAHCEQFIKYDCFYAALLNNGQPSYGWWVSRDGVNMSYWGGVTSGDFKCACGLNKTCAQPDLNCNCDMRDEVWRVDSGLLTNKSDIPVSQLRFGDTGINTDKGEHTLGKLKCYGIADSSVEE